MLVEERVDVVVLEEVAVAGADDVEGPLDDLRRVPAAGDARQLALVLLEEVELLRQWNHLLQKTKTQFLIS